MTHFLILIIFGCFFAASQLFWFRRLSEIASKFIPNKFCRKGAAALGAVFYVSLLAYNFHWVHQSPTATVLTLRTLLLQVPLRWWVASSLLGFGVVLLYAIGRWPYAAVRAQFRKRSDGPSSGPATSRLLNRRQFFSKTGTAAGVLPFAACAYGFLFGRLDYETSHVRLKLPRLPRSFEGFRIAQLSDIHISPFMGTREIRKVVDMTNALKADLIVLTGDYVTWDPTTQGAVVEALSGLKAPYGIYGCLGNHEMWTHTQASITRLFAAQGTKILRQQRAAIHAGNESLNLIGVDFESLRGIGPNREGYVRQYLQGVQRLVNPGTVNILLSHNPNTFDRAAALGIDLSLAGHTHGGQISLEFINRDLSPARFLTPYVEGYFEKPGGQLYVNRGIGTIGVPIRFDAPPEITIFELARGD